MLPSDDDLMNLNIPPANPDRRAETLRAANLAFREKNAKAPQRIGLLQRLLGIKPRTPELHMRKIGLFGGSAMALVLAVLVSTSLDYMRPSSSLESRADAVGGLKESIDAVASNGASTPSILDRLSARSLLDSAVQPSKQNETDTTAGAAYQSLADTNEPASVADSIAPAKPAAPMKVKKTEEVARLRSAPGLPTPDSIMVMPPQSGDKFANLPDNVMQDVAQAPVSTFSADTDTAGYSVVRKMLDNGQLPPPDAVRTEEMINYFHYNYALPDDKAKPFQPMVSIYPTPWNPTTKLLHIGIKAFDKPMTERPAVNLVFLVDVSGSMDEPNKLPMVKASFALLLEKLQPTDTVAIVTYAGNSGVALPPTSVDNKQKILDVLNSLGAGGSTAGAEGLKTAYDLAKQNYKKEGVNRILLATDGDFNVGVSAPGGVAEYVAQQRSSGIFLSVLGYGMGNYQDTMMQAIAQNGNGVAAYIDSMSEARRVLGDQVAGTLFTVAKDVKLQVEFNPAAVKSYRLIGYETRALKREDFDNDKVDAGEIGSGHEVTAIYEIVPSDVQSKTDLHFQQPDKLREPVGLDASDIAFLRIRYKLPKSDTSQLIERPVTQTDAVTSLEAASPDVRFAAAVAGFSRLLRHSVDMNNFSYGNVVTLADGAKGNDPAGERQQFVDLVRTAQSLDNSHPHPVPSEEGGVAFPPAE